MKTFSSMGAFAEHLLGTGIAMSAALHHAVEQGAQEIEARAKKKLGEYQDQVGPFIAWPELADATKRDRLAQGYSENEPGLRSGEMRSSIEHVSHGLEAQIGSNDDHMVYFELGTSRQPPRSALGGAAAEIAPRIVERVGVEAYAALIGEKVFEGRLPITGE